jgi:hypothetical protein
MSTVVVGTLKSTTSSPPTFQNTSGTEIGTLCRAWVNFNGTGTVAIRASFNVSSITDNGTGDYTVNFTTALADANYTVCGACNLNITGNTSRVFSAPAAAAPTTTAVRVATTLSSTSGAEDQQYVHVAIFR